ncbi:unnamed protein product, partial [Penicillium discolor]
MASISFSTTPSGSSRPSCCWLPESSRCGGPDPPREGDSRARRARRARRCTAASGPRCGRDGRGRRRPPVPRSRPPPRRRRAVPGRAAADPRPQPLASTADGRLDERSAVRRGRHRRTVRRPGPQQLPGAHGRPRSRGHAGPPPPRARASGLPGPPRPSRRRGPRALPGAAQRPDPGAHASGGRRRPQHRRVVAPLRHAAVPPHARLTVAACCGAPARPADGVSVHREHPRPRSRSASSLRHRTGGRPHRLHRRALDPRQVAVGPPARRRRRRGRADRGGADVLRRRRRRRAAHRAAAPAVVRGDATAGIGSAAEGGESVVEALDRLDGLRGLK